MRLMPWDRGSEQLQQFDIRFFKWPLVVRYILCSYTSSLCIVLHRSLLMFDVGSCFLLIFMIPAWCDAESPMWCTCCHDSSCCVLRSLCCMLMGYSCVAMHACFEIPSMPCWWDAHHAWVLCHTDRSLLIESFVVEHLLEPLLREGIFFVWSRHRLLCTTSLLATLNEVAYTILRPGPRDVVPPRRTPLSTSYVFMCSDYWHVPVLYNMHMYSLMFF